MTKDPAKLAAKRERERLRRRQRYDALIQKHGGRCMYCGSLENLTIEHPGNTRTYALENLGASRIKQYEIESAQGLISVACQSCQSRQGMSKMKRGFRQRDQHITTKKCFCYHCRRHRCFSSRPWRLAGLTGLRSRTPIRKGWLHE